MATMPERLIGVFDAIFNGGKSMLHGESLQFQIDRAGERTWKKHLIGPYKDSKGKDYFTTPAQQAQYDAQALARIEGEVAGLKGVLTQIAQAANKGVAVDIDYDKIAAMMPKAPEYKLTPLEDAK